jgi:predicted ATPase
MMRLNQLYIRGFKDPDRKINLEFSPEPITVIYGENGCGKTTLLNVLHAILSRNSSVLSNEKIQEVVLEYSVKGQLQTLHITKKDKKKNNDNDYDYRLANVLQGSSPALFNSKSILFGVQRGIITRYEFRGALQQVVNDLSRRGERETHRRQRQLIDDITSRLLKLQNEAPLDREFDYEQLSKQDHILADFIPIGEVKTAIFKHFRTGQEILSKKVDEAISATLSKAFDIELETEGASPADYQFDLSMVSKLRDNKDFLDIIIQKVTNNSVRNALSRLLEGKETEDSEKMLENKLFRALLINIWRVLEKEENFYARSVDELVKIFNDHLYQGKQLALYPNGAPYIDLGSEKKHSLAQLSSGERHLLTFLTFVLVFGKDRNFFLVDEPEVSLNTKWQRELLPLLSKLNPGAQLIVATHNPFLVNRNTQWLMELL